MSPSLTSEPVAPHSPVLTPVLATAIVTYLDRSVSAHAESAALTFVGDAVVVDDGKTYTGQTAIAAWLSASIAEFEDTTTQLSVDRDAASNSTRTAV